MTQTETYLRALWPELPESHWLLVYTLPDKMSHWCDSVERAAATVEQLKGVDIYLQMATADKNYGPFARATRNETRAIPGLWCDLDLKNEGRKKSALPKSLDELLKIIPEDARPTMLVQSGGGLHAYWLFNEPLLLDTGEDRSKAEKLLKDWQTLLRRRAQVHGWTLDFTHDLPRILRIPGTLNYKQPETPRIVSIVHDDGPRYWPEEVREMLDESDYAAASLGIVDDREELGDGWKSLAIQVQPHVTIDEDFIEQVGQIFPKFRQTWNHDRADITGPDGAFSEYDLALANFGVAREMSPQAICNLMVAFRRKHGGKPKWRPDYYKRTIWRAMHDRRETPVVPGVPPGVLSAAPETTGQAAPAHEPEQFVTAEEVRARMTDAQRLEVLDTLSLWLGIRVLRILKITGKDPSYLIETETKKVLIESVEWLLDQKKMRLRIGGALDVLIPKQSPDRWESIAAMILAASVPQDSGEEQEVEGETRLLLEGYLRSRPFVSADSRDDSKAKFPMVSEGEITVSLIDIRSWIAREQGPGERPSLKALAVMLSAIEARKIRWRRGSTDGHRWALPVQQWPPEQFTFTEETTERIA